MGKELDNFIERMLSNYTLEELKIIQNKIDGKRRHEENKQMPPKRKVSIRRKIDTQNYKKEWLERQIKRLQNIQADSDSINKELEDVNFSKNK